MREGQRDAIAAWQLQLAPLAAFAMQFVALHHVRKVYESLQQLAVSNSPLLTISARLTVPT